MNKNIHSKICELKQNNSQGELNIALNNLKAKNKNDKNGTILNDNKNKFQEKQSEHENDLYRTLKINNELDGNLKNIENLEQKYFYLQNEKDKRKKKKKQFYKLGNSILNNLDPNNKSTFLDTCENKSEKKENPGSFYFSYNSYEKNSNNNNSSQKNYTFENRNDEDYNSFKSSTKDIQNILNRNPDMKLENFNTRYNSFVNNKQKSAIYYMKNEEDNYTSNKDNISSENDEIDDDSYNKLLIPSFPKGIKDNVQTEKKIQNIKDKLHEINYKSQNLFNKIEEEYVQKFRNNGNYFNHEVDNYYTTDNNKNLFPNKFNENNCIFEQNIKDFPYQGYSGDISLNQKITQGKENYNDQYVISNYINQTNNEIEVITADGNRNNANLISLQKSKNNNFTKSNNTIYTKPNIYKNNKLYNSYNYINQNLEYMQNDVNNINTTNIHKIIRENIPPKSQDGPIINETPNFVSRIINGNTSTSLYDEKLANNNTNNINNALNSNADLKFHSKTGISNLHVKNCTNNMNRGNEHINNINKLIINYRNKEEAKENEKNVKKEIHISGINLSDGGNFSNPIASNMKWNNNSNLINSMTNVNDTNKEKYWIKKTYIDNTDIHNSDTLSVPNNMNKLYDLKNEKPKKKNDLNINNKDTIMISGRYPENSTENNNRQIMKNDIKLAKNVFMNSENQIINSDTNKLGNDIIYHNNRQVNDLYNKKLSYFDELENMDHEKNDSYANCNRNMKLKFDEIHSNDYPVFHDQNSRKKWEQSFNKYSNNLKEVNNHGKNLISNNSINATSANFKSFQQTNSINHEHVKDYKRKYHNINYDFKQNQLLDINDTKNLNLPNQYISKNFMATHIINEDENILGSTKMSSFDGITKLEDEKNAEYLTGEYSYINGTRGENKLYNNENTDCFRKYKDLINTNINNEKYNANGKYNKNNFFSSVNISDRANTKNITEIGKYQSYQKDYNLKTFKNKSVNPQSFLQIKNNTAEIQNNDYNFRHTNLYYNEVNHIDQEITKSKYENSNIPNKIYINDFLAQNYNETIEYHFNANNKIRNEIFISSHDQTIRTNVDTEQNDIVNNYNIEGKYNIRNIIKESTNTTICYIIQNILQYCNKIFNDLYVNNDLLKKKKRNELNLYLIKLRENNYEQFFFNLNKYFEALLAFLNSNYIYKCNSSILYNICIVVKNLFFLLNFGVYIFHIIKVCAHCIVKLILMNPISIIDKTWFFLLNLYRYIFQKLYEHFKIYFNNNENHPMDKESLEILVSFINTFNEIIIEYGKIRIIARNKKKEELIAFPLYEALKPFFFLNTSYYDNSPKMNEKNEVKFSTKILISSSDSSDCNNRSDSSNSNNYESYHSNKHSRGNSMEKTQEKIEHYMNIDNMYDQIVKRKQKNENKKENKNKFYNENSDFLDCKSQCSEKNRRENIFEYTNNASNEILDKQNKDHAIHSKNSITDTKNYIKKNNDDELSIYMRNNLLCSMQTLIKMFSHIYINNWDKILYYYNENTNERIPIFLTIIINDHNQKLRTNSILCLKYLFDCKQLKYWFLLKTNIYNSDTNDFNNGQSALKDEESAISVSNMIVDQSKDNNSHSSFNNSNDNNKIKKNIDPTNRGEYYQHSLNDTYAHEQGYAFMAMVNDDIPLRKYASPKIETQIKYNYIDTQIQNIICPENLSDLKNIVNDNNSEGSGCIIDKKLDKETEKDIYICDKTIEEINSNNQESLEKQNEKNKIHKKGSTYTNMNKGNKNLDYSTQTHGEADYKNGNINYKKLMIEDNIIKMLSHLIKLINKTYLLNNENNFYTPIDRLNIYRFFLRVSQSMLLKKYKNLLMKILKTSFFYLLKYLIYFNNGDMLPFCGKKLVQNKSNLKNKKQHILHNNSDNELTFLNNGQSINKGDIKKNKKKSHTLSNNFLYIIDEHNSQNIRKTQSFIQNTSGTSTQVVGNDHIDEEHMFKSLNNSSECFKKMGKYEEDSIYIIRDPEKSYPYHEKELKNNFKYLSYNSEHNDNAYGKKTINKIKNKDIEIDTKQFLQEDAKNETYINYKKEKANNKFKDNESMINTIDEKIKKKHLDIDKHKIDENVYKGNNLDVIENEKNIETHNGNTQCFRSFYDSVQHAKEFNDDKMICNLKDQKSDESICGIKREHIEEDIISIYSDKKTDKRRKNKNKDFFQIFQNEEMEPNTQMNKNENDISYLYKNINKINRKLLCKKNYELLIRVLYCNEYSKNSKYICTITVIINIFSVLLCEYNDDIYNFLCTNIYRKNINKTLNNRNIFCENSTQNYLYNISFVQLIYFMLIFLYKIFYQTCDEAKNNLITNIGNPSTYNINDTFNNAIKEHLQNENNYNNKNGGMTNNNQFSTDSKYETGQKNGVINKDYNTNCDNKTIYNNTESCNNIEICSNKNNYLKDKKTFTNNSYTELFNKYITSYTQREFNKNKNVNIFDKYNLIPYDMQIFKNMFAVFQKTLKYYLFCYMHCWNDVKTLLEYFLQSENINIKIISIKIVIDIFTFINAYYEDKTIDNNNNNSDEPEFSVLKEKDNAKNSPIYTNEDASEQTNIDGSPEERKKVKKKNIKNDNLNDTAQPEEERKNYSDTINVLKSTKSDLYNFTNVKRESKQINKNSNNKKNGIHCGKRKQDEKMNKQRENNSNSKCQENYKNYQKKKFMQLVERDMIYLFRKYILMHIHSINKIDNDAINKRNKIKHVFFNTIICISQLSYEGFKVLKIEDIQKLTSLISSCANSIKCNIITTLSKYIIKYIFTFNKKFIQMYEKKINLLHINSANVYYNNILSTQNNFHITKNNFNIDILLDENSISSPSGSNIQTNESHQNETSRNNNYLSMLKTDQISDLKNLSFLNYSQNKQEKYYKMEQDIYENGLAAPFFVSPDSNEFFQKNNSSNHMLTLNNTLSDKSEECLQNMNKGSQHYSSDKPFFKNRQIEVDSCRNGNNDTNICNRIIHNRKQEIRNMKNKEQYFTDLNADNERKKETNDKDSFKNMNTNKFIKFDNYQTVSQKERDNNNDYFKNDKLKKMETNTKNYIGKINIKNSNDILMSKKEHAKNLDNISHQYSDDIKNDDNIENENYYNNSKLPNSQINVKEDNNAFNDSIYILGKQKNEKKLFELYYIYIYIIIHIIKFYNESFVDLKYYIYNCICEIASSYIPFYFTQNNIKSFSYYSNHNSEENKDINEFISFINNINTSTNVNDLKLYNFNNKKKEKKINSKKILKKTYNSDNENDHHTQTSKLEFIQSPNSATKAYEENEYSEIPGSSISTFIGTEKFSSNESGNERLYNLSNSKNEKIENNSCIEQQTNSKSICVDTQLKNLQNTRDNMHDDFSTNIYLISYIEYIYILLLIIRGNRKVEKDRAICCIIRYLGFICKNMNFFLFNSINLVSSSFLNKYFVYLNNLIEKNNFFDIQEEEISQIEGKKKKKINKNVEKNNREINIPENIHNEKLDSQSFKNCMKKCIDAQKELNHGIKNEDIKKIAHDRDESINQYGEKIDNMDKKESVINSKDKLYHLFLNIYVKYEYDFDPWFISSNTNVKKERKIEINSKKSNYIQNSNDLLNNNEQSKQNSESKTRNVEDIIRTNPQLDIPSKEWAECYSYKKIKNIASNPIIIEIKDIFNSNINKNGILNNPNNIDSKIILYLLSVVKDHIKNKITWNVLYAFKLIYNNFSFFFAHNFTELHNKILDSLINILRFTNVYKIKILSSLALMHIPLYYDINKNKLKELWDTLISNIIFFDVTFSNDDKSNVNPACYYYNKGANYFTISKKNEYKYKCTLRINICELLYICIYRSYIHSNINTSIEINNEQINCYEIFKKYTHIFNINNDLHIYNLTHIFNNHVLYYSFYNNISKESEDSSNIPNIISNCDAPNHQPRKTQQDDGCNEKQTLQPEQSASNEDTFHEPKQKNKNIYNDETIEFQLFLNRHFDKYNCVYRNLLESNKNTIFLALFLKLHYEIKNSLKKIQKKRIYNKG